MDRSSLPLRCVCWSTGTLCREMPTVELEKQRMCSGLRNIERETWAVMTKVSRKAGLFTLMRCNAYPECPHQATVIRAPKECIAKECIALDSLRLLQAFGATLSSSVGTAHRERGDMRSLTRGDAPSLPPGHGSSGHRAWSSGSARRLGCVAARCATPGRPPFPRHPCASGAGVPSASGDGTLPASNYRIRTARPQRGGRQHQT